MTDEKPKIAVVDNYLIQAQEAMRIMNDNQLFMNLIKLDTSAKTFTDTIWVNGERVKIDPNRPVDFSDLEERVISVDMDPYRAYRDEAITLSPEEFRYLEPQKPAKVKADNRHWVQNHPRSMRKR